MRFQGKVALVTGGGVGIGKATALAFAREGAAVAVAGRRYGLLEQTVQEIDKIGRRGLAIRADVTQEDQVIAMADRVLEAFGQVDILVANAGLGVMKNVIDMSVDEFAAAYWVNNVSTFLCCRECLKKSMIPRRTGSIITVSSRAGKRGYLLGGAYSTSRWGIIGFTQALAWEVGMYGIRVNCVCPGPVMTDSLIDFFHEQARATGQEFEAIARNFESQAALRKLVTPEEVANLILFLCSDEASAMTGQAINISAGGEMR